MREQTRPFRLDRYDLVAAFALGRMCLSCDSSAHRMTRCPLGQFVCPNCHATSHRAERCAAVCRFCLRHHAGRSVNACIKQLTRLPVEQVLKTKLPLSLAMQMQGLSREDGTTVQETGVVIGPAESTVGASMGASAGVATPTETLATPAIVEELAVRHGVTAEELRRARAAAARTVASLQAAGAQPRPDTMHGRSLYLTGALPCDEYALRDAVERTLRADPDTPAPPAPRTRAHAPYVLSVIMRAGARRAAYAFVEFASLELAYFFVEKIERAGGVLDGTPVRVQFKKIGIGPAVREAPPAPPPPEAVFRARRPIGGVGVPARPAEPESPTQRLCIAVALALAEVYPIKLKPAKEALEYTGDLDLIGRGFARLDEIQAVAAPPDVSPGPLSPPNGGLTPLSAEDSESESEDRTPWLGAAWSASGSPWTPRERERACESARVPGAMRAALRRAFDAWRAELARECSQATGEPALDGPIDYGDLSSLNLLGGGPGGVSSTPSPKHDPAADEEVPLATTEESLTPTSPRPSLLSTLDPGFLRHCEEHRAELNLLVLPEDASDDPSTPEFVSLRALLGARPRQVETVTVVERPTADAEPWDPMRELSDDLVGPAPTRHKAPLAPPAPTLHVPAPENLAHDPAADALDLDVQHDLHGALRTASSKLFNIDLGGITPTEAMRLDRVHLGRSSHEAAPSKQDQQGVHPAEGGTTLGERTGDGPAKGEYSAGQPTLGTADMPLDFGTITGEPVPFHFAPTNTLLQQNTLDMSEVARLDTIEGDVSPLSPIASPVRVEAPPSKLQAIQDAHAREEPLQRALSSTVGVPLQTMIRHSKSQAHRRQSELAKSANNS